MTSLAAAPPAPTVALSAQIVKGKTRVDRQVSAVDTTFASIKGFWRIGLNYRLSDVKSLNCWGQDLADVSFLCEMPNVEVLSLSVNRICTLKDFSQCVKLQELYLRKNEVADVTEVQWLASLPDLRVLWLSDNPCAKTPSYRQKVLQILPKLTKLDNDDVVAEERPDSPQTVPQATEPQSSACTVTPSTEKPSAIVAEHPFLGANPVFEQVHQPAQLQAALATPHQAGNVTGQDTQGAVSVPHLAAAPSFRSAPCSEPSALALSSKPSFRARDNISAKPPASFSANGGSSSSNVLYAVIALLGDLDAGSLQIVHAEVEQRLRSK